MIEPAYVRTMARYNGWENNQLARILQELPADELAADLGAFFGSIIGTVSHLLWADMIWLSRFDTTVEAPQGGIPESPNLFPTFGTWSAQRSHTDGQISLWASQVKPINLRGELQWYSGAMQQEVSRPIAMCITHFFNHQTHHRGQLHAMLTAAGHDAPVSDLFVMPEDA